MNIRNDLEEVSIKDALDALCDGYFLSQFHTNKYEVEELYNYLIEEFEKDGNRLILEGELDSIGN